jgi:hypothetical protein
MRRLLCLLCLLLGLAEIASAQRIERFPADRPDGPWAGAAAFQIAAARPGVPLVLRLIGGAGTVAEAAVEEGMATLDLSATAAGEYTLQLVALGARRPTVVFERWPVSVGGAPLAPALPRSRPASEALPALRFLRRFADDSRPPLSGALELRIDGAEGLPTRFVPVIVIEQYGREIGRSAEVLTAPFVARWDSRLAADGPVVVRLLVQDTARGILIDQDVLGVTVRNAAAVVSTPTGASTAMNLSGSKEARARQIADLSRQAGDRWPLVAAAQWALESGWGQRPSGRNNVFGIKSWDGSGSLVATHEWHGGQMIGTTARFADYPTLFDGIAARVAFLRKSRYAGYWSAASEEDACRALQSAGYATDPSYASQLIDLVRRLR